MTPKHTLLCAATLLAFALQVPCRAQTVLFADTFNRANSTDLNASPDGKSGTLGALNWNEVVPTPNTFAGDVEIVSNGMALQSGSNSTTGALKSGVPYVDHNFIGYTSITVAFDFVSAPASGSIRQLGFGIGNTKAALEALTLSGSFGDIWVSFDRATSLANSTPETGIQIGETGGDATVFIPRTIASGDTLSATFTFADMNANTPINYEVFHEGVSIHTGVHFWSSTNQNYIGLFNSHKAANGDNSIIDNFSVTLPGEPSVFQLTGFTYDPSDGSAQVSIEGSSSTRYNLVEAADLDFSTPDQNPVPLSSATVGTLDGNVVITDANGDATFQFNLGTGGATFIRAEQSP